MAEFNATFGRDANFNVSLKESNQMNAGFGETQRIATGDYNDLANKPKIEDVELKGNRTLREIGVDTLSVQEIEKILYLD